MQPYIPAVRDNAPACPLSCRRLRRVAWLALAAAVAVGPVDAGELVTPAPLTPEESRQRVRVPAGYRVDLVAAEPLVFDPVAFDWDERGRLWVVEMADYPLGLDGKGKPGGRVRILEDRNQDGIYDHATLFADGLSFPTGILTWRDGCLVTAAPDILLLRDTDGDGRADVQKPLLTGFNVGNQQLRINGLRWGLDGWVYCANGGHNVNYGKDVKITSVLTGERIALGSRDFRFRPDTGEFDPLSGPAQFGRTRDAWGRWFGVQNSYPIWHYVLEDRYLRRNPHVAPPSARVMMTPTNPRVFSALAPEKRYHTHGQANRYASACSAWIVSDPLLFGAGGGRIAAHAFVCEPVHNLVQHLVVEHDGNTFKARRDPAEELDFFASTDRWCRPVMIRTGPEGGLWVADMYRLVVEHPQFLPAHGQQELMPYYRAGDDRGRIYRVLPERHQAVFPRFPIDSAGLVAQLHSANGWVRDKAHMLLTWRADKTVVPALENLARREDKPAARVHALHLLGHFGALADDAVIAALRDAEPGVREQALVLAETKSAEAVIAAAAKLVTDPNPKVRLQLACTLGAWRSRVAGEALAALAENSGSDAVLRGAIASSLVSHLEVLAARFPDDDAWLEVVFVTALGERRSDVVLTMLERALPADASIDGSQLRRARSALMLLRARNLTVDALAAEQSDAPRWHALVARKDALLAAVRAGLQRAPVAEQAALATLLLCDPKEQPAAVELLGRLLAPEHALHPIGEYVNYLARTDDARVPELLLQHWSRRTPEARGVIIEAILSREAWVPGLLARVKEGTFPAAAFDAQRRARLLQHPTIPLRRQAASVFGAGGKRSRQEVVDTFRPALTLKGDATRGRVVFAQTCTACHQLEGVGIALGPDLRAVADHSPEKLLISILDPSADIEPGFMAYFCELTDGEQIYGSIASETGTSISFRLPDGATRAIPRGRVKSLQTSNVSLMPEGLEAVLTPQGVSDLIAYLKNGN